MAAPTTAYLNNAAARRSIKKVGVIQYDLPLALNSYGTWAQVKSLFHLDAFKVFKKSDGTVVFIGMIKEGGANINKHSEARWSKKRSAKSGVSTKEVYIWLNDAGLNTYATIANFITTNFSANPAVSALFTSSYYSSTTYGFLIQKWTDFGSGDVIENNYDYSYTLAQQSIITKELVLDMALPVSGSVAYEVYAYAENDEGRVYSQIRFDLEAREQTATYQASAIFLPGGAPGVSGAISLQYPAWRTMQFAYEVVYLNADGIGTIVTLAITIPEGETQGGASEEVDNYDDGMGDSNNKTETIQERRVFQRTNTRHYPQI